MWTLKPVVVVSGFLLLILALAGILAATDTQAAEHSVKVVSEDYAAAAGEDVVSLGRVYADIETDLTGFTTGQKVLPLPGVTGMDPVELDVTDITLDDTDFIVTIEGTGSVLGIVDTSLLLVATWPDDTATTPTVSLGTRADGLNLSGIYSGWQLPGGLDPGIETAWIILAPTGHDLPVALADAFYPDVYNHTDGTAVNLPTGTEYYGEVLVESLIGTHATNALGLTSTSTAGLGGNIVGTGGTAEAQGSILNGTDTISALNLTASVPVPGAILPAGITAMGNIDLHLEYDDAVGSLKTGLNTDFTLDPALGGPGFVAVGGTVGYGPISVELTGQIADWDDALGTSWLDLNEVTLGLSYDDTGAGASFAGDFTVGTKELSLEFEVGIAGSDFEATMSFTSDLGLGDVIDIFNTQLTGASFSAAGFANQTFTLREAQFTVQTGTTSASFALSAKATIGGAEVQGLFALTDPAPPKVAHLILALQSTDTTLGAVFGGAAGPLDGSALGALDLPAFDLMLVQSLDGLPPATGTNVVIPKTELNPTAQAYFDETLPVGWTGLHLGGEITLQAKLDLRLLGDDFAEAFGYDDPNPHYAWIEGTIGARFDLASGTFDLGGIAVRGGLPPTTFEIPPFAPLTITPELGFAYLEDDLGNWAFEIYVEALFTLDLDSDGTDESFDLWVSFATDSADNIIFRAGAALLDWNQPFGITWLDLNEVSLALEYTEINLVEQFVIALTADGDVGGKNVVVTAAGRFGVGYDVSLTVALNDSISLREMLVAFELDAAEDTVPDYILDGMSAGPASFVVAANPAGFTLAANAEATFPLFPGLPDIRASVYLGLDSTPNVTVGIRLSNDDPVMLSDVLAGMGLPAPPDDGDLPLVSDLANFGFVASTAQWTAPGATVNEPTREFFAPLYGEDPDDLTAVWDIEVVNGFSVIAHINLPESLAGLVGNLGITPGAHIVGSLVLAPSPELAFSIELSLDSDVVPDFIHSGELRIELSASAAGVQFKIAGQLAVRFPAGMPSLVADGLNAVGIPTTGMVKMDETDTCDNGTVPQLMFGLPDYYCYDVLAIGVDAAISFSTGGLEATIGGQLLSLNSTPDNGNAPWNPFGLQWIGMSQIRLEVTISLSPGPPPAPAVTIGFFASAQIGDPNDPEIMAAAGKIGIAPILPPVPPFVRVEFDGIRLESSTGLELSDLVDIVNAINDVTGAPHIVLGPDTFPDIALRNIEFSLAPAAVPSLCIPMGLVIGGDLYINPTTDGAGLLPPQCIDGVHQEPEPTKCSDHKGEGCFAGVQVEITTDGIIALGEIAGFDLGLIEFDDAAIDLEVSLADPHFEVYGGVDVKYPNGSLFSTGDLALSIDKTGLDYFGQLKMFGYSALVDGRASLDILSGGGAGLSLHVLLASGDADTGSPDWEAAITAMASETLNTIASIVEVFDGILTDLATGDPVEVLRNLGGRLTAVGVPVPPWLSSFLQQAAVVLGPLGQFSGDSLDLLLNGYTFPPFNGIQGYWEPTSRTCYAIPYVIPGTVINGECWGTWYWKLTWSGWKKQGFTRGWYFNPVCWSLKPIPGFVVGGTCYAVPPIPSWSTGGVCHLIFPKSLYPEVWSGDKCTLSGIIEGAVEPVIETALELAIPGDQEVDLDVMKQRLLDALRGQGKLLDFTCAEFELDIGTASQEFGMALDMELLGTRLAFDFDFDFSDITGSVAGIVEDLIFGAPPTVCSGLNTELFEADGSRAENPVDPPPPRLGLLTPGSVDEGESFQASGSFTAPVPTARTVRLDWGDGASTDVAIPQGADQYTATHTYDDEDPAGTNRDDYTVTATDLSPNGSNASRTVTVRNVDPTLALALTSHAINENAIAELDIEFIDPGTDDHSITITWGDGEQTTLHPAAGTRSASATHTYPDDDPTGTPVDAYTIDTTLTDDDLGSAADSITLDVANVEPGAVDVNPKIVLEGSVEDYTTVFSDPGPNDVHLVEFDWDGNGQFEQRITVPTGTRSLQTSHAYLDDSQPQAVIAVSDDDGGRRQELTGIVVENVAPHDLELILEAETIDEGDAAVLVLGFADPGILDTHDITIDWGDGTAADGLAFTDGERAVELRHTYVDDDPTTTPDDIYTIAVTVDDDDGGSVGGTTNVSVLDIPVVITPGADQITLEGSVVGITAGFTDVGLADSHTATIDWGDGSPMDNVAAPSADGVGSLAGSHVYADNGTYTVTLEVTDDDSLMASNTMIVTVGNVLPTIEAGTQQRVFEDDPLALDPSTFHDQGTLDTHLATVDWGDGTPVATGAITESPFGPPGSVLGADGTIDADHVYPDPGIYRVTVCVTDDDAPGTPVCDILDVTVVHSFVKFAAFAESSTYGGDDAEDFEAGNLSVSKSATVTGSLGANGDLRVARLVTATGDLVSVHEGVVLGIRSSAGGDVMAAGKASLQKRSAVTGDLHAKRIVMHHTASVGGVLDLGTGAARFGDVTWIDLGPEGAPGELRLDRGVHALDPGTYPELEMARGTLLLRSGTYRFGCLEIDANSTIRVDLDPDGDGIADPLIIETHKSLEFGRGLRMQIVSDVGDATDIVIHVDGHVMVLGARGTYLGTFIAENGIAAVGTRASVEGAVYARSVRIGTGASLAYQPAIDQFVDLHVPDYR